MEGYKLDNGRTIYTGIMKTKTGVIRFDHNVVLRAKVGRNRNTDFVFTKARREFKRVGVYIELIGFWGLGTEVFGCKLRECFDYEIRFRGRRKGDSCFLPVDVLVC